MLNGFLTKTIYVKVYENRFVLKLLDESARSVTIVPTEAFTTERLLVGQFGSAQAALKKGVKDVLTGKWFAASPVVIIQPMQKIEGGLSQVEESVFKELAAGAGAAKVTVWVGHELSDVEALKRASNTR